MVSIDLIRCCLWVIVVNGMGMLVDGMVVPHIVSVSYGVCMRCNSMSVRSLSVDVCANGMGVGYRVSVCNGVSVRSLGVYVCRHLWCRISSGLPDLCFCRCTKYKLLDQIRSAIIAVAYIPSIRNIYYCLAIHYNGADWHLTTCALISLFGCLQQISYKLY